MKKKKFPLMEILIALGMITIFVVSVMNSSNGHSIISDPNDIGGQVVVSVYVDDVARSPPLLCW